MLHLEGKKSQGKKPNISLLSLQPLMHQVYQLKAENKSANKLHSDIFYSFLIKCKEITLNGTAIRRTKIFSERMPKGTTSKIESNTAFLIYSYLND